MNTVHTTNVRRFHTGTARQAPSIGFKRQWDPTDNKTRGYRFLYAIYPDYWKSSWGQKPLLGFVRADSEFHAKYAAYDKGLLPVNNTFGPEPVLQPRRKGNQNGESTEAGARRNL